MGVGFSPGDDSYAQPYFYVAPWPHPKQDDLPKLSVGHWHTAGFTAAVLTGDDILQASPGSVADFLSNAIRSATDLLTGQV